MVSDRFSILGGTARSILRENRVVRKTRLISLVILIGAEFNAMIFPRAFLGKELNAMPVPQPVSK